MHIQTPEEHIIQKAHDYESMYLDAIEARNNSKPGSKKERDAEMIIDAIEVRVSMLVFNNPHHSFTQCLDEVDMWTQPKGWETSEDITYGRSGRYPLRIPSGTPVERRGRYWCIAITKDHLVVPSEKLVRTRSK
jgi:hypothetical protein